MESQLPRWTNTQQRQGQGQTDNQDKEESKDMEFQTYSLCPGSSKHLVSRFSFPVPICSPNCTASEQLAL